jgi:superfamily II DNA or RNA helicase
MLRDFQTELKGRVYEAWHEPNVFNVMMVGPTGSGKTVTFCDIVRDFNQPACVIAHRQELVGQAALALNRERVEHSIIAPKKVVQQIIGIEHDLQGYSCYNSRAPVKCAGVDTIIRHDAKDRWYGQVGLVVQDEGHHVLKDNKWGRAQLMFPNGRGLFPTAHAVRADRQGLGRDADGLADRLVIGPYARQLINRGYLTDYRIICVGSDIDFSEVEVTPSGEFSMPKLRAATHSSNKIVGDVVKHYLKYAAGKLGVTFAVDIEAAVELRNAYQLAGVPAEVITSDTPLDVRGALMRKFRARQILQLVSVDCLGEGVDVPAIEVISMVRKTASWQLMCQQFGRALRVMVDECYWQYWDWYTDEQRLAIIAASSKPKAIIIDHVGNILWHAKTRGLPDSQQEYALVRGEINTRGKSDAIPLRACTYCFHPYERWQLACPQCGGVPEVWGRGSPELVDGDLIELDPQVLQALRGEIDRVNGAVVMPFGIPPAAQRGLMRSHHDRFRAQQSLQRYLMIWGGWQDHLGRSTREAQKLFYIRFGIDVMSAQTLNAADATALEVRIAADLQKHNIVEAQAA